MTFIDFMAGVAIAVFWVHMLLMGADAVVQWRGVRALSKRLQGGLLVRGTVLAARGPDGVLAEQRTHQRGRSKGDAHIHFHDRTHESEIFGGRIRLDDESELELGAAEGERVEVWASSSSRKQAAAPGSDEAFDEAYGSAQKAKGWLRVVRVTARVGDVVWVLPDAEAPLVALDDPRRWVRDRSAELLAFLVAHAAVSLACTGVTVWPPMYGTLSKIGAFASLVYFMQVQDFTRIIRERVRPPSRAFLRGQWSRPNVG